MLLLEPALGRGEQSLALVLVLPVPRGRELVQLCLGLQPRLALRDLAREGV